METTVIACGAGPESSAIMAARRASAFVALPLTSAISWARLQNSDNAANSRANAPVAGPSSKSLWNTAHGGTFALAPSKVLSYSEAMDPILQEITQRLYPDRPEVATNIMELIEDYRHGIELCRQELTTLRGDPVDVDLHNGDAIFSCPDQLFAAKGGSSVGALRRLLREEGDGLISMVRLATANRGDYRGADVHLGDQAELLQLAADVRWVSEIALCRYPRDGVWYAAAQRGDSPYRDFFAAVPDSAQYVPVEHGHPAALLEFVAVMLEQLTRGAGVVRLDRNGDARIGTAPCDDIVRVLRRVIDLVDPQVLLLTDEAGSADAAHLVREPLGAPLLLDALIREDCSHLQRWAAAMEDLGPGRCWVQNCAVETVWPSPFAEAYLDVAQRAMVHSVIAGRDAWSVSAPGRYNFAAACADSHLPDGQRARPALVAHAVCFALIGVPEFEWHGSFGFRETEPLSYDEASAALTNPDSFPGIVLEGLKALLTARLGSPAFAPRSPMYVLRSDPRLFAIVRGAAERAEPVVARQAAGARTTDAPQPLTVAEEGQYGPDNSGRVLCIHNVSREYVEFSTTKRAVGWPSSGVFVDLISGDVVYPTVEGERYSIELEPFEVLWLEL